ncbi:MAG: LysR family transcriptional regulator [Pseudomonadota bacterium]
MAEADFNLLTALDMLLTTRSVAGAARRLGLSASAMSRTLSRLRTVTGDPLLVRAGREMVLTPYAEEIRERTRKTVFAARELLRPDTTALCLPELERTFILRANDGFISAFGAALIAVVSQQAPGVRLCFIPKPEKNVSQLREGRVDIEIGVAGDMGPEIRLQALFRDRFVGVVNSHHPLAQLTRITLQDYIRWPHIASSRRGKYNGPIDSALAELGFQREVVAVVPGFAPALAVVTGSELIAQVPASFLQNYPGISALPGEGALRRFELPVKVPGITVSQMWHPRSDKDPAHRWLREQLRTVCRREPLAEFSHQ